MKHKGVIYYQNSLINYILRYVEKRYDFIVFQISTFIDFISQFEELEEICDAIPKKNGYRAESEGRIKV